MLGVVIATWLAEKEINRRGENGESIWYALIWVLPIGVIGARAWYVANNIFSGSIYYIDNPIKTLYVWEGGLHIFGGFLFGGIALILYLRKHKMDVWLFLDSIAPATLIGQAIARPANFINQELYGQPTNLPWGIPIQAAHRLSQYSNLNLFPVETTRFHPTFAYEMIWNFLAASFLIWYSHYFTERMKPGATFSAWLIFAGVGRSIIELFRPDQPLIPGTLITYSMAVSIFMALLGLLMLLVRYEKINFFFAKNWEKEYKLLQPTDRKKVEAKN
jgi:phosphatidylglycerol:prolipoprotein diacylglycerol transferase